MPIRNWFAALLALPPIILGWAPAADAAPAGDGGWPDYQIVMWQDQTPARLAGLARLGITAGKIFGSREHLDVAGIPQATAPFRALDLRWYVENIATDFYAAYHRWLPGRSVTQHFEETKELHRRDPADIAAFIREPSLSDPVWLDRIQARLRLHVQAYDRYRPLYYSLADEAGIADLAAAWDFDFAPASLDGMRTWLKGRYPTLAALNREWGTAFPDWRAVMPMTTDAAIRRPDENFAGWLDFKAWMDFSFARAVRAGTDAVHGADPQARAALEGGQIPGWGGYDYGQLAPSVDVMELYDYGNDVEIAHSLAPKLIVLKTTTLADAHQLYGVWHSLLLGGRGTVLWDEDGAFVDDGGAPTERGRTLGALATELTGGLGAQMIASTRAADPVAILYSQPSLYAQWLLDRRADGKPWADRPPETEYDEDNPVRAAMRRAAGMLAHLGVSPRWMTPSMIEQGALRTDHVRALVLPHTIALSPAAAARIRDFAAQGGTVLADTVPGSFDGHGRRLAQPLLAAVTPMPDLLREGPSADAGSLARLRQLLGGAGIAPAFTVSSPDGSPATNVDTRVFHDGDATIVGLQRDWADGGRIAGGDLTLDFKAPVYVYDLRKPGPPRRGPRITLTLDGVEPALLAVTAAPLPALALDVPSRVRLGGSAELAVARPWRTGAPVRVVHAEAVAPDGRTYRTNLVLEGARASWRLPLAGDAPAGNWTIRLVDVLSGQRIERTLAVSK